MQLPLMLKTYIFWQSALSSTGCLVTVFADIQFDSCLSEIIIIHLFYSWSKDKNKTKSSLQNTTANFLQIAPYILHLQWSGGKTHAWNLQGKRLSV